MLAGPEIIPSQMEVARDRVTYDQPGYVQFAALVVIPTRDDLDSAMEKGAASAARYLSSLIKKCTHQNSSSTSACISASPHQRCGCRDAAMRIIECLPRRYGVNKALLKTFNELGDRALLKGYLKLLSRSVLKNRNNDTPNKLKEQMETLEEFMNIVSPSSTSATSSSSSSTSSSSSSERRRRRRRSKKMKLSDQE